MDLWLIQNGEKTGPFHDYEIRRKIETGDLPASTPAWHEGLPAWKPLAEIPLFDGEFERLLNPPAPAVAGPVADAVEGPPPPMPERTCLWRRFFARWFDLIMFGSIWWFAMWATGRDIEAAMYNPWALLLQYIPWFVLESVLLHRYATTPGKWLLGLAVINNDGSRLSLAAAIRRSARVLCIGLGFGWGLLPLLCQGLSCFAVKRIGRALWDHAGGHRVTTVPLRPLRVIAYVVMLFAALQLQWIVVAPYTVDATGKMFPALKENFEKNPPWHLPKRH